MDCIQSVSLAANYYVTCANWQHISGSSLLSDIPHVGYSCFTHGGRFPTTGALPQLARTIRERVPRCPLARIWIMIFFVYHWMLPKLHFCLSALSVGEFFSPIVPHAFLHGSPRLRLLTLTACLSLSAPRRLLVLTSLDGVCATPYSLELIFCRDVHSL